MLRHAGGLTSRLTFRRRRQPFCEANRPIETVERLKLGELANLVYSVDLPLGPAL